MKPSYARRCEVRQGASRRSLFWLRSRPFLGGAQDTETAAGLQLKDGHFSALHREGFTIAHRRDVIPRTGLAPLFSLFACRREAGPEVIDPPFVVRDADGLHTIELRAVRRRFGWP